MISEQAQTKWVKIITGVCILILLILIGWKLFGSTVTEIPAKRVVERALLDEKIARQGVEIEAQRKTIDSIAEEARKLGVAWEKQKKLIHQQIKTKYDEKRTDNDSLTADQQFMLFSNWISKADSLGR